MKQIVTLIEIWLQLLMLTVPISSQVELNYDFVIAATLIEAIKVQDMTTIHIFV